jgi:hypothetical protein
VECSLWTRKLKLQLSRTFLCKLLIRVSNSIVSREIWINMHSWVFQRPQIALVLWTRAILRSLKNSLVHVISKLHSKPCYYLYTNLIIIHKQDYFRKSFFNRTGEHWNSLSSNFEGLWFIFFIYTKLTNLYLAKLDSKYLVNIVLHAFLLYCVVG